MAFCVYTAITGNYDVLVDPPEVAWAGADFIAFMECSRISHRWDIKPLVRSLSDPCRDAKIYKILPHKFLAGYEFSLWVDGSVDLIMPFPVVHLLDYLADADLAIFEHPSRHCIYQEGCQCIHAKLDNSRLIHQQMRRYTQENYPANIGLVEATVILRRHNSRIADFNERWWEEISKGSRRDQLSFNYVAWKSGLKYAVFPHGLGTTGSFFRRREHHGIRTRQ